MEDPSADGVCGPQVNLHGSKVNEEAAKFSVNTNASYDPRKLYIRENFCAKNQEEFSSTSNADSADTSEENTYSNSKRKKEEDSYHDDDKKQRTGYLMNPSPKRHLTSKGPGSSVLYNSKKKPMKKLQNNRESSSSSCESDSDSDTELSFSCSFGEEKVLHIIKE